MRRMVSWASGKHPGLLQSSVRGQDGLESQFGYRVRPKDLRKIHRAASQGDVAAVQYLLLLRKSRVNDRDKKNRTALHLACAEGQPEVVTLLLERKCMINAVDNDNMTPLMKAVQCHEAKCASLLLSHGADPNVTDENGNTALHFAAYCDNVRIANQLLIHSANMEGRNKDGFTPLLLAIYEDGEDMAEFLIQKGANIHAVDNIRRTALMLAAQYRSTKIVRLLLQKGIDASCQSMNGWPAEKFALVTFNMTNRQLILDYEEQRSKMLAKNKPDTCNNKIKPKQGVLKEPAHDSCNINNSKSMEPELGDVSSLKLNDLVTKVGQEEEKLDGSEDDQPLSKEEKAHLEKVTALQSDLNEQCKKNAELEKELTEYKTLLRAIRNKLKQYENGVFPFHANLKTSEMETHHRMVKYQMQEKQTDLLQEADELLQNLDLDLVQASSVIS
ncbi:putative ankyrin repeat domain-containing protein 19 isoform X1 [Ochotona princeps]|uniref:putative ankyrin repeat domain-containing protein 19 isoform X1 n=1 Tax=Ochotona princeps TaxID=9978 RepID=UPI0027155709|nr:putative ankyrin repeat domain-containing protein 19 isoform X1 [Ochotona princeps]